MKTIKLQFLILMLVAGAALDASAEPPMYTTLSGRTLTTLPELNEIWAPERVSVCTTSPT